MNSNKSFPVDLDQVTARLLQATRPTVLLRQGSGSTAPSSGECDRLDHEFLIKEETESYHKLVADGGRPWYPLYLLEDVSKNSEAYRDILGFWDSRGWLVYSKQWERWQKFRRWQRDNRGPLEVQADFDRERAGFLQFCIEGGSDLSEFDTEERRESPLQSVSNRRRYEYRYTVEKGVSRKKDHARFEAYVLAVATRLQQHGFTRPFQLDRRPSSQDTLTAWIEYLNYEYWVHDGFVNEAERLQSRYNEALTALQNGNVLRPEETLDFISTLEYGFTFGNEKHNAQKAAKAAKAAVLTAREMLESTNNARLRQERGDALAQTQTRLDRAIKAAKAAEKRYRLIHAFLMAQNPYKQAKENAERHKILLRWILNQIPLIETEGAENVPHLAPSSSSNNKKRAREDDEEEALGEDPVKRHKSEDQPIEQVEPEPVQEIAEQTTLPEDVPESKGKARPVNEPPPNETPEQPEDTNATITTKDRKRRSKLSTTGKSAASRPLRRSARIAALQARVAASRTQSTASQSEAKTSSKSTSASKRRTGEGESSQNKPENLQRQQKQRKRRGRSS